MKGILKLLISHHNLKYLLIGIEFGYKPMVPNFPEQRTKLGKCLVLIKGFYCKLPEMASIHWEKIIYNLEGISYHVGV